MQAQLLLLLLLAERCFSKHASTQFWVKDQQHAIQARLRCFLYDRVLYDTHCYSNTRIGVVHHGSLLLFLASTNTHTHTTSTYLALVTIEASRCTHNRRATPRTEQHQPGNSAFSQVTHIMSATNSVGCWARSRGTWHFGRGEWGERGEGTARPPLVSPIACPPHPRRHAAEREHNLGRQPSTGPHFETEQRNKAEQ